MKKSWNSMTALDKLCKLIVLPCSVVVIILAVLQLVNIWPDAAYAYMPLMCIVMVAQVLRFWKSARLVAVISLCAAVVVLVCNAVIWIVG